MSFREAFLIACDRNAKATRGLTRRINAVRKADPRNPAVARHWARMEARTVARYKKQTRRTVTDFGDGQFLAWLIEHLPEILKIIMAILALFGI